MTDQELAAMQKENDRLFKESCQEARQMMFLTRPAGMALALLSRWGRAWR
jgi:hypothetical protein